MTRLFEHPGDAELDPETLDDLDETGEDLQSAVYHVHRATVLGLTQEERATEIRKARESIRKASHRLIDMDARV